MSAHPERHRRLLFGRRKGPKLSAHQQQLLKDVLPALTLHLQPGADPKSYFQESPPPRGEVEARSASGGGQVQDIWLEIGFGGGEHLAWQAEHNLHIGIMGAEPFVNGIAKLLSKFDQLPHNIRIHAGDAREIIAALPGASLGRVFILFPDPWPKTRHHKRRFIQSDVIDELARVMRSGAELRFASDDAPYLDWTLERLTAHPAFTWTATCAADWRSRTDDWPQTRYEAKQLHGVPAFLSFLRR